MTSAPVDLRARHGSLPGRAVQHLDRSARTPDQTLAQEPVSPARGLLPWALLLLVLSLVVTAYAVLLGAGALVTGALVLTASVLGAVAGLSLRDARDRWVPARRALGDGLRRLGRALWH